MRNFSVILLLALVGCAGFEGAPKPLVNPEDEISALQPYFKADQVYAYYAATPGTKQRLNLRNQIVTTRMQGIDLRYLAFERQLDKELRAGDFATDIISIGLTGSAALFGGTQTKAVLAGIDTALKGGKKAYQDDVLIKQTLTILTTQMNAKRKSVGYKIWLGLGQSDAAYPLSLALNQLQDYYYAGTLQGALNATSGETSQQLRIAQANFDTQALKEVSFNPGATENRIRRWLEVEDISLQTQRIKASKKWFGDLKIDLKGYGDFYTYILSGNADAAVLRRMIRKFNIP